MEMEMKNLFKCRNCRLDVKLGLPLQQSQMEII